MRSGPSVVPRLRPGERYGLHLALTLLGRGTVGVDLGAGVLFGDNGGGGLVRHTLAAMSDRCCGVGVVGRCMRRVATRGGGVGVVFGRGVMRGAT